MTEPKKPDPNATIQLDQLGALDDVVLEEQAPRPSGGPTSARKAPPPLPPGSSLPPGASGPPPSASVPPSYASGGAPSSTLASAAQRGGKGKTVAYAALFVVLLVVAIGAGLSVAGLARGKETAPVASAAPTTSAVASASAPAATSAAPSASGGMLIIPETEIVSPKQP